MHSRKKQGMPSRSVLLFLAVGAVVVMFIPREWTSSLMSAVQVIVPFQDAAGRGAEAVSDAVFDESQTEWIAQHEEAQRQLALMEHVVAGLTARVRDLESENERLVGTRAWAPEGYAFGPRGRLIPAKIISSDVLPWRSSRLLNAGTMQGVSRDSAVISKAFSVNVGGDAGVEEGMAIILRESLIGFVEDVGTHTSRAKLISDLSTERRVQIGRMTDDGFVLRDRFFWLRGRGKGRMEISDVMRRTVDEGDVAPGDLVLLPAVDSGLPTSMCIGRVDSFEVDRENPLLAKLHIVARIDENELHRVYVYQSDVVISNRD